MTIFFNFFIYLFIFFFRENKFCLLCRHFHMKCQDLFALKNKKKIFLNVVCYKFCLALWRLMKINILSGETTLWKQMSICRSYKTPLLRNQNVMDRRMDVRTDKMKTVYPHPATHTHTNTVCWGLIILFPFWKGL